jgi:hypothetical protein
MNKDTTTEICGILNQAFNSDPVAIAAIFDTREKCNEKLGDDPFIEVSSDLTVSPIGIINGILNFLHLDKVAIMYDEDQNIVGFGNYGHFKKHE